MLNSYILKNPIVTEKATRLQKSGTYLMQVHLNTNKDQISEAISSLYKVKVGQVRIVVRKGKVVKVGKRRLDKKIK